MGPLIHDKMYVSLRWSVVLSARIQFQMDQSELRVKPPCERPLPPAPHKPLRKAEEVNFKSKFSFFTSLSAAEAHVFGVKFIGLYGTVVFIAIRDFSFWGESDLWSDVWPAMDGVVCLSILLEGGVTVSE